MFVLFSRNVDPDLELNPDLVGSHSFGSVDPDPYSECRSGSEGIKKRIIKSLTDIFFLSRRIRNKNALQIIQEIIFLIFKV